MTDEELRRLEGLAEKATPGPWSTTEDGTVRGQPVGYVNGPDPQWNDGQILLADAELIAASRSAVPALVAEVRMLKGHLIELARQLGGCANEDEPGSCSTGEPCPCCFAFGLVKG